MSTNALHSLYGGKVARLRAEAAASGKALAGNVGGQERQQTVLTPWWFIQELTRNVGAPLGYDPCTTGWNPTKAKVFSTEKSNGLTTNWASISRQFGWIYVNEPFKHLHVWLNKMNREGERGAQIYCLAPHRPWRTWFCELTEPWKMVSLAPFPFVGETSAYPAPLCLIAYNLPLPTIYNPRGKNMVTGVWTVTTGQIIDTEGENVDQERRDLEPKQLSQQSGRRRTDLCASGIGQARTRAR